MPDSDSDSECFVVGKVPGGNGSGGKWHLFREEDAASLCGKDLWGRLHQRVEPRRFDPETDGSLDDVIGLGELCQNCREYVTGSLSDRDLPKPEKSTDKCWTGNSILEDYRQTVATE